MPRPGDVYTKSESDAKYATKTQVNACVPKTQLTANSKDFIFAYDSTSEKYGYKAGSDGDFVPFEQAGLGFSVPNPITTGLTYDATVTIDEGGYQVVDDICYVDMTFTTTHTSGTHYIAGLPNYLSGGSYYLLQEYMSDGALRCGSLSLTISNNKARFTAGNANTYRVYGEYPIATS